MKDEFTIQIGSKKTSGCVPDNKPLQYLLECHSDIGTARASNQDACCARMITRDGKTTVMAVVCDGVGGLSDGEYASRSTIHFFNHWFDHWLAYTATEESEHTLMDAVSQKLDEVIHEQNRVLYDYGIHNGVRLGTTLTVMVFLSGGYLIAQVGDSRAYCIKERLVQLTEDQSLVAREVREGRLGLKEALTDPRRNIILQCMGGQEHIAPVYQRGVIEDKATYLLCSDGFIHEIEEEELERMMAPRPLIDRNAVRRAILDGIECVKRRGEKDNITAVVIRTM